MIFIPSISMTAGCVAVVILTLILCAFLFNYLLKYIFPSQPYLLSIIKKNAYVNGLPSPMSSFVTNFFLHKDYFVSSNGLILA